MERVLYRERSGALPYHIIDHTSDVAADLTGSTPGDIFVSAAQALTDTITDVKKVKSAVTEPITLEAELRPIGVIKG